MKELKVRVTFTEPVLGTKPNDPEIHTRFVASKAPDAKTMAEEVALLGAEKVEELDKTVFLRMSDGTPCIKSYQLRGFIKEALGILYKIPGTKTSTDKSNYYRKKKVDNYIFVTPELVPLWMPLDLDLAATDCQRPLRADTPQGPRVALAHSEEAPAGTYIEFTVVCMMDKDVDYIKECLDYGKWKGFGQWRNASYGRFEWEEIA